jgi:hypothetical protein
MSATENRERDLRDGADGSKRQESYQNTSIFRPRSRQIKAGCLLPLAEAIYSDHP